MPGISVAPNPVVPNASSNVASNGNANGANNANDAANSDNSFSSALQRSMKSNSNADKPAQQAHNDAKTNSKADAKDAPESSATTASAAAASQTTAPDDPLASLLPMLQGKFAQVAQTMEQSGDGKEKAKKTTDDDSTASGQENLLASLAGAMGAQQQLAPTSPATADSKGDAKSNAKADAATGLAGQPAIIATEDALNGHAKKAGEGNAAESGFQALLDSAHSAQQAQHGQDARMARATSVAETRIETPVGHDRWPQEVGDKLTWMVNKQESSATLVLNPPHMGRVEVNITMNGDQASAAFASSNPAVREALENALPRLKEVLADAGVQLGQAQVGADSRGDSSQNPERRDNRGHNKTVTGESIPGLAPSSSSGSWTRQGNGMVDTFV